MSKKLLLLAIYFAFLVVVLPVSADVEKAEKKYGVTYPIVELGSCTDFAGCHSYCADPVNETACVAYAKKKGFYKAEQVEQKKDEIMSAATKELGCGSAESCKAYCSNENNFEQCTEFAKKYKLGGGKILDPKNEEIVSKAKEILGCDSPSACKAICEQEANRDKCSNFAKKMGLKGGEERKGPGGCNSEETCKAYCSDPQHGDECSKFGPPPGGGAGKPPEGARKGPGGCSSDAECRAYCDKNPKECQGLGPRREGGGPRPEGEQPGNYNNDYCKEHPDQCKGGPVPGPMPSGEDFCKQNPDKCQSPQSGGVQIYNGDDYCKQNPQACNGVMPPQGGTAPVTGAVEGQAPSQGEAPQVQGASSYRGWLQGIFDFFF